MRQNINRTSHASATRMFIIFKVIKEIKSAIHVFNGENDEKFRVRRTQLLSLKEEYNKMLWK